MGRSEASTPAEHTRTSLCADNRGRRARARVEACCRRMPAARRKPRARRSAPPSAWRVRLPALEQRHWDLIGLGLVAIGIFLVFLVYLGWDGGQAGSGLVDGLAKLVGELHYLVPVALLAAGALVFLRDALPAVRPFRAAALCLGAAGCLALAAGTLGLGAGGNRVEDNGGYVGEGLYDAASTLVGDVGAHIIAVFLFIAGMLLLTGASVASVLRATGDSVTASGRAIRETAEPVRTAVQRRRTPREELDELEAAEAPTVTRTHLEQDFWSGPERFPDLYEGGPAPEPVTDELEVAEPDPEPDPEPEPAAPEEPRLAEDPETDEPGVVRGGTEVDPADLTPQGRLRRSVTDAPDFVWRVPDPGFLTRSGADASKPDTVGQEKVAAQLVEALGHFGVEARVIGMVAGPAHHPLRAAPRARHQGRQGRPAQGRPRLRAGRLRHPHPRADPRQAGGRRRGAERAPPDRPPGRRDAAAARRLVAADRLARQGRRGPRDRRRPGQDAAPARRGHDRRGQVRRRQRDAREHPAPRHAARGPAGARRPQAGRAQPLRLDPAPAHARDHVAEAGRDRAAEPRARDGAALQLHGARPHPQPDRDEQGARAPRRAGRCRTSSA